MPTILTRPALTGHQWMQEGVQEAAFLGAPLVGSEQPGVENLNLL